MENDLQAIQGIVDELPNMSSLMRSTLDEMQKGSEPDSSADYWEEKDAIDKNLSDLKQLEEDMSGAMKAFQKKKSKTLQLLQ